MAADLYSLQWPVLLAWLIALFFFLAWAATLLFSRRAVRSHIRVGWTRPRGPVLAASKWLLAAVAVAIVLALLLPLSAAEQPRTQVVLALIYAAVTYVCFGWAWKQVAARMNRTSEQASEWKASGESARRQLSGLLEEGALRRKACELLQNQLQVSHASLWQVHGDAYQRTESSPQMPVCATEFGRSALLPRTLAAGRPGRSLMLLSARRHPLHWSPLAGDEMKEAQAQLATLFANVAVSVQNQAQLEGFFLLGPRTNSRPFAAHHLEFAEVVARQLLQSLHSGAVAALVIDRAAKQAADRAAQQASRRSARATLTHLYPPQRIDVPGIEYGVDYWLGEQPTGVCYDIVALPNQMALFLLADIEGPAEDAAIRLVQFQALIRNRAWTHMEDLAELARHATRGLAHSLAHHPPISFFCARPVPGARRIQYLNAGHFPPILLRRSSAGAEVTRLHTGGPAIGPVLATPYQSGEIELGRDDLVVIPSRSLISAVNAKSEAWSESRLVVSLLGWENRPVQELTQKAIQAANDFTAADPQQPPRFLIALRSAPVFHGSDV